jgi:hypothetical protein
VESGGEEEDTTWGSQLVRPTNKGQTVQQHGAVGTRLHHQTRATQDRQVPTRRPDQAQGCVGQGSTSTKDEEGPVGVLRQAEGGGYAKVSNIKCGTEPKGGLKGPEEGGYGKISNVPEGPGLRQGPISAEAWLGRGEGQTSEGSYGVKPNSRERCVKDNNIDWRQEAHGGVFCTSCKIKLMMELEVRWEELEEVHVRIPCTRTRVDRQRYYSR